MAAMLVSPLGALEVLVKRKGKAPRAPPQPTVPVEEEAGPLGTLPEIRAAVERVRGHAAKWLAERDTMARRVAEYEALKSAQSTILPHTGNDGDKI